MADIDAFWNVLRSELADIAADLGEDIGEEFIADGKAFLEATKQDLLRWLNLLEEGKITPDEFTFLVQGRKDLARMEMLKQVGLAQARIDMLKRALVGAVVGSAVRTLT